MRGKHVLRVGVTALIASVILLRVPVQALQSAFTGIKFGWLIAALGCVAAMLAARCYRWHRLLSAGGLSTTRADSARSLMAGFTLSVVTPGRLGEFGRCLFVEESDRPPVLMLNVFDRILDMWALFSCAVLGLMALSPRPHGIFALGIWLAVLPAAMGLPTFVGHLGDIPWWPVGLRARLREARHRLLPISTPDFAGWALLSTSFDLLTFYCLLRAFQPVSLLAVLTTFPFIVIAGGMPISISGLGPREGLAAILLARYGVPSAVAIDATLLLWAFSALAPAAVGAIWLAVSGSTLPRFSFSDDCTDVADKQSA